MKMKIEDEDFNFEKNIDDLDAIEMISQCVKVMRLVGYHDVSIWRALSDNKEQMEECLKTVEQCKDEWSEK